MVMPTARKTQKNAAVTREVATNLQSGHTCKQADASSPTTRKGIKRKASSNAHIPPRRSYNLRRKNPLTPHGPPVCIELSDVECDDKGDSDEKHDNSSGEPAKDESMSNDGQEQDSSEGNSDHVNGGADDNISSSEIHENEHVPESENNEVTAVNASLSKLTRHVPHGNTDTAAMAPSPATTTMIPLSTVVDTAAMALSGTAATAKMDLSSEAREPENILDNKVPTTEVQHSALNLPIGRFADEWTACMNEFMAKFDSEVECISGMDAIVPTLSGVFVGFQGMDIPSELVDPLVKFTDQFCGGDVLSLVKKDYTSKKKRELIIDFGKLLFSMEVHQVRNEETFLIWRDACRDFAQAGLDIDFVTGSLKEAARHYFGYMMRPEGSNDQFATLQKIARRNSAN